MYVKSFRFLNCFIFIGINIKYYLFFCIYILIHGDGDRYGQEVTELNYANSDINLNFDLLILLIQIL